MLLQRLGVCSPLGLLLVLLQTGCQRRSDRAASDQAVAVSGGATLAEPRPETVGTAPIAQQWANLDLPIQPRYYWKSATDGKRFVLWSGQIEERSGAGGPGSLVDGALFENGTWKALPPAPIEPRAEYAFVLSGDRLVIWGGGTAQAHFNDGAVYDLKALAVRKIPSAPIPGRAQPVAVDLGGKVLFWGGRTIADISYWNPHPDAPAQRPVPASRPRWYADGAILHLETLTWKKTADCRVRGHGPRAVWTGTELAVLSGLDVNEFVGLQKSMQGYEVVPHIKPPSRFVPARVFTGGALYDSLRDAWSPLPDYPALQHGWVMPIDGGLLAWGKHGALFTEGQWHRLPSPPVKAVFRGVKKGRALLWRDGPKCRGAVLELKTGRYVAIPKFPLAERYTESEFWDGESLLVSGGTAMVKQTRVYYRDGARWTAGDNMWTRVHDCPLDLEGRYRITSTADARYLVVWGGSKGWRDKHTERGFFDDAAIYDIKLDRWKVVKPLGPLSMWIRKPRFVWLGEKLFVIDEKASHLFLWTAPSLE